MAENNDFWDFYWETRLLPMENLGKRAAILAVSGLIRRLAPTAGRPLRLRFAMKDADLYSLCFAQRT